MRLTDSWFEAEFISRTTVSGHYRQGDQIEGADGILFYSPCGYGTNDGTHAVLVSFANPRNAPAVPANAGSQNRNGQPSRWTMSGTGLHDLTLTPSIDLTTPRPPPPKDEFWHACWHGFITVGEIT